MLQQPIFSRRNRHAGGFTLVEMIVVIGIIAFLTGMLLPTLNKAQAQANRAKCVSNLHQIGVDLLIYAGDNNGYLFPDKLGWPGSGRPPALVPGTTDQFNVWTYYVFNRVWNPAIMLCPADLEPVGDHSYILNDHMAYWRVKYSSPLPNHRSSSEVVLMGEKISSLPDYYMEYGEFDGLVDAYRHGLSLGSNYLMLDMHVDSLLPNAAKDALDPWDFGGGTPPATQNSPG